MTLEALRARLSEAVIERVQAAWMYEQFGGEGYKAAMKMAMDREAEFTNAIAAMERNTPVMETR